MLYIFAAPVADRGAAGEHRGEGLVAGAFLDRPVDRRDDVAAVARELVLDEVRGALGVESAGEVVEDDGRSAHGYPAGV
jgi:hypothetical protein